MSYVICHNCYTATGTGAERRSQGSNIDVMQSCVHQFHKDKFKCKCAVRVGGT